MQGFWNQSPEVPVVRGVAHTGSRIALYGVVEVGKLQWVAQEEYGRVVPDKVPVALVCVELHCESAYVSFGVGGSTLTGHGREAQQAFRLFPYFGEYGSARELCDVVGYGKSPECAGTFGMHTPFRYDFTVEMGDFFSVPRVLDKNRAANSGSLYVLVVGDGPAVFCGESMFVHNR